MHARRELRLREVSLRPTRVSYYRAMRLAWFSPLPPVRSGISAYSADLLAALRDDFEIDCFVDAPTAAARVFNAHEFSWRHRRRPYDLTVYQLGNAPCHDYMWAYLAAHPGLVVLHDARLHHARARALLSRGRTDDYRAEFRFDHPDAPPDVVEFAVEGLGGPLYSFWTMLRVVVSTARTVAVHNTRVADDLRADYPGVCVETIRMGVGESLASAAAAAAVRRQLAIPQDAVVCAAFGKMTAEKRLGPVLSAFREAAAVHRNLYLVLIGDTSEFTDWTDDAAALERVRRVGYVSDEDIASHLAASDLCLCLRWPTALETSASWLHGLSACRATIITDLAHLADIPAVDPRSRTLSGPRPPVAVRIDLLDEAHSLSQALDWLAADRRARDAIARAGHEHWRRHHTIEAMTVDYRRVLCEGADRPAPAPVDLPAHFRHDYSDSALRLADDFGIELDMLERGENRSALSPHS